MLKEGMTVREAAEQWVSGFNAIPADMIEKLMEVDSISWYEVTKPSRGRRVYVYESLVPEGCSEGTIENFIEESDVYLINLDDGNTVEVGADDFDLEKDSRLPMWGTMWSFGDGCDDYWLDELNGIRIMSDYGFRVYEHDEWGYFFGIDGAGYDFYAEHWIPLYRERGLQWHDTETED